ncbi:3989_t:CDS:2 [Funneliformis caledonium]|uniref:3989_t:CDS:1 n=1 Tax=Funneliformis caledonium TaxID=1117310 RepID=A0A9N9EGD6_9GLOM|nr:3989_t:CDS:2 [Funneliformis caledonium]
MFELIVIEYLQQTAYKDWSIVSLLQYVEAKSELSADMIETLKSEIYSVLRSFSDPNSINLHENAKKRAWKLLSEFDKAFSSTVVKIFIEGLKLQDERKESLTAFSRKITSIDALRSLEEQRMAKVLIEIMRKEEVRGSTSTIDDHMKRKPGESHSPDNDETLTKRVRVGIESQNTTIHDNDEISPLFNIKTLTSPKSSPVESEEIKNGDTEDLIGFLKKRDLHLNEKHFNILRDQEITGCDFVKMNKVDFKECGFETGPSMRLADVAEELNNQTILSVANIKPDREGLLNELREELLNELRKELHEEFRNLGGILCKNPRSD